MALGEDFDGDFTILQLYYFENWNPSKGEDDYSKMQILRIGHIWPPMTY